jgi:hypothetical protein
MGTRNVTYVVKDNEYRVAQYCQWDGYPSGQGATVVAFIRERIIPDGGAVFSGQVDKVKHLTPEEVEARWAEVGATGRWVNMEQAEKFKEKYEHLSRDCGAGILEYVFTAKQPEAHLDLQFPQHSLFCEWVYVVNLDKGCLEVFQGFNKRRLGKKQRFFPLQNGTTDDGYYPVRLWKTIQFEDLTENTMTELQVEYEKSRG